MSAPHLSGASTIENLSYCGKALQNLLFQSLGKLATENLRNEPCRHLAGVFRCRQPLAGSSTRQPNHMFDGAQQFGSVIEYGSIRFVQQSSGNATPDAVAQAAIFVSYAVLYQQEGSEKINVVEPSGRSFKTLFPNAGGIEFRPHLTDGRLKGRVLGKSLEERAGGRNRPQRQRLPSRNVAQLGVHERFPGLRLMLEVCCQLRRSHQ